MLSREDKTGWPMVCGHTTKKQVSQSVSETA